MTKKERERIFKEMEDHGIQDLLHDIGEMDRLLNHQIMKGHTPDEQLFEIYKQVHEEMKNELFPKWYCPVKEAENISREL